MNVSLIPLATGLPVAAANSLEATFYATLTSKTQFLRNVVKRIQEFSIAHFNAIQWIFNGINAGIVVCSSEMLTHFVFANLSYSSLVPVLFGISLVPILVGTVALGVLLLNRQAPSLGAKRKEGKVEISEHVQTSQKVAKVLHVSRVVFNIALACFIRNPVWLALSLGGISYSMWKNAQLKWITFSCKLPSLVHFSTRISDPLIIRFTPTFTRLSIPTTKTSHDEKCEICKEKQAKVAFCANHFFHESCIAKKIEEKRHSILDNGSFKKFHRQTYRNGIKESEDYIYTLEIPEKNLAICTTCKDVSYRNLCKVTANDSEHGKMNTFLWLKNAKGNLSPLQSLRRWLVT